MIFIINRTTCSPWFVIGIRGERVTYPVLIPPTKAVKWLVRQARIMEFSAD
jgi:hypothetical protein